MKFIQAIDQFMYDERLIRASFGTTKYCLHFLHDEECPNPDCLFLHSIAEGKETTTKVLYNAICLFLFRSIWLVINLSF